MTEPWELRLDRALWTPTALGTVGPHGMMRDFAHGGEMSYRPLLRIHLAAGQLTDHLRRAVELVEDQAAWDALGEIPEVAQQCPQLGNWADRTVAVVMGNWRDRQFQGLLVGRLDRTDPEVAHVSTFWVPNAAWLTASGVDETLAAAWLTLFQGLAQKGAVAITAAETWSGRRFVKVLRDIAGFRPTREVYADVGLSAADSALVLVDWRATFEGTELVRFATRPEFDESAHRELLRQLHRYFTHVDAHTEGELPDLPGYRQTFKGEVQIDGPHGWGSGRSDDDWYDGPPDQFPDADEPFDFAQHMHRGPALLARWLRATIEE